MKVGLIVCDHVNQEYRDEYGDYPDMFQALFPSLDLQIYDAINGQLPSSVDECEAYMGTGSRHSVYEDLAWIRETMSFLRDLNAAKKCFVGICFSHQLIGQALGGKVEKSNGGWCVGIQMFQPTSLQLLMMCQDQVVELPQDARVVASSEQCRNGIIQVGSHFLGIQAHPEFTKSYNRMLMKNRVDRMGRATVDAGLVSLKLEVSRQEVREYILEFIRNAT